MSSQYTNKRGRSVYTSRTYSIKPRSGPVRTYGRSKYVSQNIKPIENQVKKPELKENIVHESKSELIPVSIESSKSNLLDKAPKEVKQKPIKSKSKIKKHKQNKNYEKRQPISLHIDEFRRRILYCVVALVIGGTIGYKFQNEIIKWLVKPLGQQLFYTSPTGGFDFLIKICLFFGFLLAVPVIIYNIIKFLAPAVPPKVTYSTIKLLIVSVILALSGVAFAYFVSLPAALHFLNNFTNDQIQSLISAQEYFNFVMIYLAGFALLFQMPLIFAFVNKITPLKPKKLMQKQRLVILISFIIAAVLTPTPDPMNQTLMAVPIIGLYQTSIGVVWQDNKRKNRKRRKQNLNQEVASATA